MIGAGLALTSKTVRDRAADAVAPVTDKAREMLNDAAERAQALRGDVEEGLTSAQSQAASMADAAQVWLPAWPTTSEPGGAGRQRRQRQIQERHGCRHGYGSRGPKDAAATAAPDKARQVIGDNAALIGGLGIAIGAIIAAAFPQTKAEAR